MAGITLLYLTFVKKRSPGLSPLEQEPILSEFYIILFLQVNTPCTDTFELQSQGIPSTKSYRGNFLIKQALDFEVSSKIQVQLLATVIYVLFLCVLDCESCNNGKTEKILKVFSI